VPLAAAAGPGSQAKGRQGAPRRIALEQLPGLAVRGSLARWRAAVAAGSQPGRRRGVCGTRTGPRGTLFAALTR